ncbi:MAG TPA: amino acid adenylation domain-containing protein [Thermoanaerobaculia bacterium]|jgi:amino acid adenylation domain-containing protein|nr:amino acid adenylation domain-containing protein [Thermoanaerobaculia bacterium]
MSHPEDQDNLQDNLQNGVAILAMAGRFPQAPALDRFWDNLRNGVESIRVLSETELLASGVSAAALRDPSYVRASGVLDGIDLFDAPFFGFSAREAALLDPQQRLFLECAWEALEAAGYDSLRVHGPVGVFGGTSSNSYSLFYLYSRAAVLNSPTAGQTFLGGDKDFLCTRVSYELGLRGPSLGVQTACSTSLVAVHLACQSLLNGECDMALAGGVSIKVPQTVGYFYQPSSILSADGHCRSFDARAGGSVPGSGAGVVVLKRLEDALADGDPVRVVIRGSAVNNDGALRVGFTAPSVEGQSAAIAEALALARVEPETIGYVEAHGSGTPLGDPIEIAALTRAYREGTDRRGFCAVGSVKSNIGHLDAAAGIAGLIKTVLALEHGEVPPSLHFQSANPSLDLAASPFYVNSELRPWPQPAGADTPRTPRRAGVSSFGMGGTNAHAVLEEAPSPSPSGPSRDWQLLVLSARTPEALEVATDNLAESLRQPLAALADIAFTLQNGRRPFVHRRTVVCRDAEEARRALAERDAGKLLEGAAERSDRAVAFLLPGLGDHYAGMGRGLYESEPAFRAAVDRCAELLQSHLGCDLRTVVYPAGGEETDGGIDLKAMLKGSGSGGGLDRTSLAQPALFVTEYALAQLWMEWGVKPAGLLGYSLGEYTAACLAGVLSLDDALRLVALRARLIEELPAGAMLAVPLAESEVSGLLGGELSIAAVNGPELCVVAGPVAAVEELEGRLSGRGLSCRRLQTSHAFHSTMMRPIVPAFRTLLGTVELRAPAIPYVSNVTGTWITETEATDPAHWVRHLLEPVRFGAGIAELGREPGRIVLEVGPGQSLTSLAMQSGSPAVPSLRPAYERRPDLAYALAALGRLWVAGAAIDWTGFAQHERRRRVTLPTYPFERKRYWIEEVPEDDAAPVHANRTDEPERLVATTSHARPGLATPYVAPSGPTEETLAAIWQELLGVSPVGVRDSFFDLGGHSLLASQLVARLAARFGVELPLSDLFDAPTIAELAPRLAAGASASQAEMIPRRGIAMTAMADRAPLSFAQQRLWFIDRLAPGISAYNNPVAMRLAGPLDLAALEAALAEIVRRHEIVRTTFAFAGDAPMQVIHPPAETAIPLERTDVLAVPRAERDAAARRLIWRHVERPFAIADHPPVRLLLVQTEPEEHLFIATMHHILWDEWSQGIFVRELATLYDAFRAGRPSPLPELPIQYGDFALWQRQTLQGEVLEHHLGYWKERLDGAPRLLALPTDRPRPAAQTFGGATRTLKVADDLHRALTALAHAHGVTMFMLLMAAFQSLLGRWASQDDVVVSTGTGGRSRVETESLIGCFINILLLRAELGSVTFAALLARTREATLGAYAHQDLPFELLVEGLKVERDPSTTPFSQAMLVFLNVPPVDLELPGLKVEGVRIDRESAQFDLTFYLHEEGGRLGGHLEYNTDLFDDATVDRLLGHYRNFLERAAADPARQVLEIPVLAEAERQQALVDWNRTAEDFPAESCLHELFEGQAARQPEAPGLIFDSRAVTYAELNRRANQLAHHLLRLGSGRGGRIGVSLERSPDVAVALLAVLKAGSAYVPLDPEYPEERLAVMLETAAVDLLLTQERLAGRFAGQTARTILMDAQAADWAQESVENPATGVSPEDLVYLIFTSGSTGKPKGVMLDHRGRVSNFTDFNRRYGIGAGDAVLAVSSLSFDMSAYDILGTLAGGGTIVLPRPDEILEPASWIGLLERHKVTVWHSVPAMLEMLVERLEARAPSEKTPASLALRVVLLGGDWIPVTLPDRLRALVPGAKVVSLGGATEVSMDSTIFEIGAVDPAWKSIPYGVPMANQLAYVVGPDGGPCPAGVAGELLLGGIGVGRGYFGRPDFTAERFVPDPFATPPGQRLYRTGDLTRWRSFGGSDGVLELLGRMDHQVKIRGFRIELGEIASALRRHPAVGEAVVLAREDRPGAKRLVAYLVPAHPTDPSDLSDRSPIDLDAVRDFVCGRLPAYMVPSALVVMEALPLTPNRKLDRKALPAPEEVGEERERIPPRTPIEKVLAQIWMSILGVAEVGATDNFFDLGGHSLNATRVVTQLQDVFPLEVPLRTLFEAPVLADLASRLEALGAAAGADVTGIAEAILEVLDVGELSEEDAESLLAGEPAP